MKRSLASARGCPAVVRSQVCAWTRHLRLAGDRWHALRASAGAHRGWRVGPQRCPSGRRSAPNRALDRNLMRPTPSCAHCLLASCERCRRLQGSRTAEGVTHARASALIRGAVRPLEVTFGRSSKAAISAAATSRSMEREYTAMTYLGKPDMGLADAVRPRWLWALWAFGSLQYLPARCIAPTARALLVCPHQAFGVAVA